jgi:hypothetical protein
VLKAWCEMEVMVKNVQGKVIDQSLDGFSGAPSFSEQTIEICSQHSACMVERKQRIELEFF